MPNGIAVPFQVKYERLLIFCYGCGVFGHGEMDCELGPCEEGTLAFDADIRASPWKGIKKEAEPSRRKSACKPEDRFETGTQNDQENVERLISKLQSVVLGRNKDGQEISKTPQEEADARRHEALGWEEPLRAMGMEKEVVANVRADGAEAGKGDSGGAQTTVEATGGSEGNYGDANTQLNGQIMGMELMGEGMAAKGVNSGLKGKGKSDNRKGSWCRLARTGSHSNLTEVGTKIGLKRGRESDND
ncbi:hypothetical protein RND81_06G093600 [Saponaria officinalis]|uniref:Zinc knuckle CX2CX4HX4C domain-containing protein n=1 Tax=Saponaria officinalis TaxID=3572 RepID=A0AAW1K4X1_SAPOF